MKGKRGIPDRPKDFSSVVSDNWQGAIAYVQASRQPCIKIRDDEVGEIGGRRNLVPLGSGDLHLIDQGRIWVLGVILCPGDSALEVAKWVKMNGIDPGHVWFFLHKSTDLEAVRPWADAGFKTDQVDVVDTWGELHTVFGLYLSDYIYEAKGPPHARSWVPGRRPKSE